MARQRPPLHGVHDDHGATFTEFGGWEMPVDFGSIREEHLAVRDSVGIFDVSHMGQVRVSGPDAETLMQELTTNDVTALGVGDAQYAAIVDDEGVMLDDTIAYRLEDETNGPAFLFVPNAGHDEAMTERWVDHRDDRGLAATVENRTHEYAMLAVQGPEAAVQVRGVVDDEDVETVEELGRFQTARVTVAGVESLAARTGYTGEDGFEFVVPSADAETVWSAFDCQPCGLGARDTLRIEAGYLLGGHEFDDETNPRTPYEAGIGFAVDLETAVVGREALRTQRDGGVEERLVGFTLLDRGVPRQGYDLAATDGRVIGSVTSGTMSPTLDEPIGLGYVPVAYGDAGTTLQVDVRGRSKRARVETIPFVETV